MRWRLRCSIETDRAIYENEVEVLRRGTISEALLSLDSSDAGDVMAYLLHKMKLRNRDYISPYLLFIDDDFSHYIYINDYGEIIEQQKL